MHVFALPLIIVDRLDFGSGENCTNVSLVGRKKKAQTECLFLFVFFKLVKLCVFMFTTQKAGSSL